MPPKRKRSSSFPEVANDNKVVKLELAATDAINQEKVIPEQTFADPTYDSTFKMLFGNDQHLDILISLLNALLGFSGRKKITEINLQNNELPIPSIPRGNEKPYAKQAIDIICTNQAKQKIAVEMQGYKTPYFLARQQTYMAKLISGQIKEGIGKTYHEDILETHIIIIARNEIFSGDTTLQDPNLFEIDFFPACQQTGEMMPGNKMYWKFFELPKFARSDNYNTVDRESPIKEQWLEFLINCKSSTSIPERAAIIQKGYEIMEVSKWSPDLQAAYWKQKDEEEAIIHGHEVELRESNARSKEEGKIEGKIEGNLEGEIKGEIGQIKLIIQLNADISTFRNSLNYLGDEQIAQLVGYLNDGHLNETNEEIAQALHLFEQIVPTFLSEVEETTSLTGENSIADTENISNN